MSPSNDIHLQSQSSNDDGLSRLSSTYPVFDMRNKSFLNKYRFKTEPNNSTGSLKWLHFINKVPAASNDTTVVLCSRDHRANDLQDSLDRQECNHTTTVNPNHAHFPKRIYLPEYSLQMQPFESNLKIPPSVPDHDYSTIRYCETVGNPSLNIHRLRLPSQLLSILDYVVDGCELYAQTLPKGWSTDLYSLTKQDIALRDIPHLYESVLPILSYIKKATMTMYGVNSLRMDRNQPHVLKYKWEKNGKGHTGVQLHHDKCDYTINLMLSRSSDYQGGGTFFPDANRLVRLEFGEFLIHPGSCVHGGAPITGGTRYLFVMFATKKS